LASSGRKLEIQETDLCGTGSYARKFKEGFDAETQGYVALCKS